MLMVLLIAGLWSAGLLLVAGLCIAARRGDRESALSLAQEQVAQEQDVAATPARIHEPLAAAVRLAA